MPLSQENRSIAVDTPLGKDVLVLTAFKGHEQLSRLFHFTLHMLSEKSEIAAKDIMGSKIGVRVDLPDDKKRFFHGCVSRFSAGAVQTRDEPFRHYRAEMVPWLWFLTLNSNCRIFQDKTIPDIVEQVIKDTGHADYKKALKGNYSKLDYCVQYCESDFDFISRLLERSGIFYFFMHEEKKHWLVLGDHAGAYADCLESQVEHQSRFDAQLPGQVRTWERRYEFCAGKYSHTDYNFEQPPTQLLTSEKTVVKLKGVDRHEVFHYPGGFLKATEGKTIAVVRMEQHEASSDAVFGTSTCASFFAGGKFKLKEHPVASEKNQRFALIAVEHQAKERSLFNELGLIGDDGQFEDYANVFRCVPEKVVFRPALTAKQPIMRGLQSAKVVGGKNQEILTDKYGRVKVQFHWDREGKFDDKSSCWIRVAQSWAGSKWGSVFTPRVGMEVLVDFLEGDPDRPIATGCVYNADNMPPYTLPDEAPTSGIKTFSTDKGKAKNFNELRFNDKIGKEEIYFHAERDFIRVVENDDKLKVGFETKDKGDQTIDIFNNRTVTIDKGGDTLTIKTGDRKVNIDKGNDVLAVKTGNRQVSVDKGNDMLTVKMGNHNVKISAGQSTTEAMKAIVLKVGSNSIKVDQQGVTIQGMKVTINANLKAEMKAVLTDVAASGMLTLKGTLVKIN